jgi:hypothetical protein
MDFSYELPSFFSPIVCCESAITAVHKTKASILLWILPCIYFVFWLRTLSGGGNHFFLNGFVCTCVSVREHSADNFAPHCITFHRQILSISHKDRLSSRHQLIIRKAFFGRGKRNDIFNTGLGLYRPTGKLLAIHTLTIVDSKISPGKEKVFFTFLKKVG